VAEADGEAVVAGLVVVAAGDVVVAGGLVVACFVGAAVVVVAVGVGDTEGESLGVAEKEVTVEITCDGVGEALWCALWCTVVSGCAWGGVLAAPAGPSPPMTAPVSAPPTALTDATARVRRRAAPP
jgi:hypothetical protein